jgi:hypothetical protein
MDGNGKSTGIYAGRTGMVAGFELGAFYHWAIFYCKKYAATHV